MKDRIAEFLRQQEMTPSKLAELLNVQPSSISHLLSGRNKPGFDFIVKFLQRFPTVNPDWLLLGKGKIFRETVHPSKLEEPNLFSSTQNPSKAIMLPPSIEKTDETNNKELFSTPEIKSNTQNPLQKTSESNQQDQQIEQMIICYEDHTFIKYIPRK